MMNKSINIILYLERQVLSCLCTRTRNLTMSTDLRPNLLAILNNNPKRFERIKFLADIFKKDGFELRIAGGAVRDILGGTEPQDIDFATTAKPEESLKILSRHEDLLRIIVTAAGQKHGTVAVKFKEIETDLKKVKLNPEASIQQELVSKRKKNKPEYDQESPFEITTLRYDRITDGRHAEVEFINDWRLDAERRDLTINAMFLTLDDGKLIDYFNGKSDLEQGLVKFVGDPDKRIKEDYLRILRYFRFWSRYGSGNQPDEETASVIKRNIDGLDSISGERIWQELVKIFKHYSCVEVTKLMMRLEILEKIGFKYESSGMDSFQCSLDEMARIEVNVRSFLKSTKGLAGNESISTISKKIRDLLPIIIMAPLIRSVDICAELHVKLKFSNLIKDLILYIIENRYKDPTLNQFRSQIFMAPVPERPTILLQILAFMIHQGNFETFKELEKWEVPVFPLSGTVIASESKKSGIHPRKIKTILEELKLDWAKSNYSLSKQKLESNLKDLINKHSD